MEAVRFRILCSRADGACDQVASLIKEPCKIRPEEKKYRYVISGIFESQSAAQAWGADLYGKAGKRILSMDVETEKIN